MSVEQKLWSNPSFSLRKLFILFTVLYNSDFWIYKLEKNKDIGRILSSFTEE